MSSDYTPAQRAAGKIRLAIERLSGAFPFHAAILERVKLVVRAEVGTMGVTVEDDDVMFYYNPEFVLSITADELGGVLLHEVHHVLFNHVVADPVDYPDQWARVVAEEVTVNEYIRLPLPGEPITLERVLGLPPMESTRERYERLKKVRRRGQIDPPGRRGANQIGPEHGDSVGQDGHGGKPRSAPSTLKTPGGRIPQGQQHGAQLAKNNCRRSSKLGRTVDEHGVWAQARQDPGRSEQAIRAVVEQALFDVGLDRLPNDLKTAVAALGISVEAGQNREQIRRGGRGRLDWRQLLRRYIGRALEVRPIFNRPPRRFPDLVGILPGRGRQSGKPIVMAVIDTSGSVSSDTLALIDAELAALAGRCTVTVVECDAEIQRVYRYRHLEFVTGRGGTDLRPPLERSFLRAHHADVAIYFTDGMGPAHTDPRGLPVIWCLTPGGQVPASWGRVIHMEDQSGGDPRSRRAASPPNEGGTPPTIAAAGERTDAKLLLPVPRGGPGYQKTDSGTEKRAFGTK